MVRHCLRKSLSKNIINIVIFVYYSKKNFSHFSNSEKSYLLPLMTLCGHVLLTETNLSKYFCTCIVFFLIALLNMMFFYLSVPRSSLATVSDILIYVLQFLLSELSAFSDDEANFNEFNPVYYRKLREISQLAVDSEEYYRYLLKVSITIFVVLNVCFSNFAKLYLYPYLS